jgi:hypothetical protein
MAVDDHYIDAFQDLVQDTELRTGYTLPQPIKLYVVMLLAERVEDDLQPRKTYAETVMEMNSRHDAKSLGDSALWLTGVFPHVPQRNYKTDIARIAYGKLSTHNMVNRELFECLEAYTYPVRDFITQAIRPVCDPFHP